MPSENSIEQSFKRWCKSKGIMRAKLKLNPGRGWPDQAVFLPGNITVWLEFKGPVGVTSPQQEFIHAKLRKQGHEVYVVNNLEDAIAAVEKHREA